MDRLGDGKKSYFASIALLIISMFLIGKEMFEISYTIFYSFSETYTLFESHTTFKTLFLLGYAAALAAMLVPILMNKEWKKLYFIAGNCMPIASILVFLYVLFNAISRIKEYLGSSNMGALLKAVDFSAKLTLNAWLFLVISAAAAMLTYKTCNDLLVVEERQKKRAERERASGLYDANVTGDDSQVRCPKCGLVQKKGSAFCKSCYAPFFKLK